MNKRFALGAGLLTPVWALFMYGKAIPDEPPSSLSAPAAAVPPEVTDVTGGQPAGVPQLTAAVAEGTSEPPPQNAEPAAEAPAAPPTPMPPSGHFEEMRVRGYTMTVCELDRHGCTAKQ